MYNHILVPVDGSDTSNLALKEAIALGKEQKAQVRAIYVSDETPPYSVGEIPFPLNDYIKLTRDAGEKLLAKCMAIVAGSGTVLDTKYAAINSFSTRICDVINEEAERGPADLIVIGTHGRRGFNRLLLGSVAESVIRTASKPVLIVRGR